MASPSKVLADEAIDEKEMIAGVWREDLESLVKLPDSGFVEIDEEKLSDFLMKRMVFRERSEELENDASFKQIIPYFAVVNQRGEVYSAVRKSKANEIRLRGERTIGFGGHLRQEDMKGKMQDWLRRELDEEMKIDLIKSLGFFGLINDESDANGGVNKVHLGLFFEVWVRGEVELLEKEKMGEGKFYAVNDLVDLAKEMGTWSVIALKNL